MFDLLKWGRVALAAVFALSISVAHADGPVWESTSSGSAAANNTDIVSNDVSGYQTVTVQFTSVGSGNTVTFAGSNDGTNWITAPGVTTAGATHTGAVAVATGTGYVVPLTTKYFRARITTYSSGTVAATVTYKNAPTPSLAALGSPQVTGNVASGATDSGNPVKVGGVYATTPAAVTDGQRRDASIDSRGQFRVVISDYNHANGGNVGMVVSGSNSDNGAGTLGHAYVKNYNLLTTGTNWDRDFTCASSAVINVAAAATTQLVALQSSQIIRVCSFVISGDTLATTATFVYGTGSNCATGQTALTGAMRLPDEGSIALSGMNGSLFRGATSNALCLTAATGAVTGFVTYAQY